MYKHTSFAIAAAVLLTAIVTVTLYTVNAANAQGNATNATGGTAKNMSGVAPGAESTSSCVKVLNREEC